MPYVVWPNRPGVVEVAQSPAVGSTYDGTDHVAHRRGRRAGRRLAGGDRSRAWLRRRARRLPRDGEGAARRCRRRRARRPRHAARVPRRPRACRHMLVVRTSSGEARRAREAAPVASTAPRLMLVAEIDGRAGVEPVVTLSPANVYRPGAVFAVRSGKLVRLQLRHAQPLPARRRVPNRRRLHGQARADRGHHQPGRRRRLVLGREALDLSRARRTPSTTEHRARAFRSGPRWRAGLPLLSGRVTRRSLIADRRLYGPGARAAIRVAV